MRIKRIADGGPTPTTDLSAGLFVTTGCLDTPLPYSISATPIPARAAASQAALAAIPPTEFSPFDPQTVLRSSFVDDCSQWPNDVARQPYTAPLPDVPALLLGGRLDTRTPIENARATAAQLPHASVVTLHGSGHDATDSDDTGCIARATSRFFAGRTVGNPCRGRDNSFRPLPSPPRSLNDFRSAPGVGGVRGRAVFATLDSVNDAIITAIQLEGQQLAPRGGGLRGASWPALERDPSAAAQAAHLVLLDPPAHPAQWAAVEAAMTDGLPHLAWGEDELRFAEHVHAGLHNLRDALAATYRALRDGAALPVALGRDAARPWSPVLAGRVLRVMLELGLVDIETGRLRPAAARVDLELSATYRACAARLAQGEQWLSSAPLRAA